MKYDTQGNSKGIFGFCFVSLLFSGFVVHDRKSAPEPYRVHTAHFTHAVRRLPSVGVKKQRTVEWWDLVDFSRLGVVYELRLRACVQMLESPRRHYDMFATGPNSFFISLEQNDTSVLPP